MPIPSTGRAIDAYRAQLQVSASTSTRNEARRSSEQQRKSRESGTHDNDSVSFAEVLRRAGKGN